MWKSVQERGCEKSGKMISFATAMKENYGLDRIPLYSFLGNRSNILILNGAGVYFMYQTLLTFFDNIEKENKLLAAVWDLEVLPYYAACKALGLIGKLLTGPLWRLMVSEKNVLKMSPHYQKMLECFELWAIDASSFLSGDVSLFSNFFKPDEMFNFLLLPNNERQ